MRGVPVDVQEDVTTSLGQSVDDLAVAPLAGVHHAFELAAGPGRRPGPRPAHGSGGSAGDGQRRTQAAATEDPAPLPLGTAAPHPVVDPVHEGVL